MLLRKKMLLSLWLSYVDAPMACFAVSPAATAAAVPTPRDRERGLGMRERKENLQKCKWRDRMQDKPDIIWTKHTAWQYVVAVLQQFTTPSPAYPCSWWRGTRPSSSTESPPSLGGKQMGLKICNTSLYCFVPPNNLWYIPHTTYHYFNKHSTHHMDSEHA